MKRREAGWQRSIKSSGHYRHQNKSEKRSAQNSTGPEFVGREWLSLQNLPAAFDQLGFEFFDQVFPSGIRRESLRPFTPYNLKQRSFVSFSAVPQLSKPIFPVSPAADHAVEDQAQGSIL
jgi:hypothetical protein